MFCSPVGLRADAAVSGVRRLTEIVRPLRVDSGSRGVERFKHVRGTVRTEHVNRTRPGEVPVEAEQPPRGDLRRPQLDRLAEDSRQTADEIRRVIRREWGTRAPVG